MNEEQPQPAWPAPWLVSTSDRPLTFCGTVEGVDVWKSSMPGRFVTQWHKHTRVWGMHDIHQTWSRVFTRRYRAVQARLKSLDALMR